MTERGVAETAASTGPASSHEADAVRFARELYDLEGTLRRLPGERDENFHLATAGVNDGNKGRRDFVLKIAMAAEREETLELQAAALSRLAERAPTLPLQRIVPAADGRTAVPVELADGSRRWFRILTYLPGTVLAEANPKTPAMLEALGRFLGELDAALDGFTHPAARDSDLAWNPARALEVITRHREAIEDPERRALVDHFVATSDATLAPILHRLRSGVIHNDANDYNVLFGPPASDDPRRREVAGLLDFGDMLHAWIACEPAVAMAYAMFDQGDPLEAASHVAAGYHRAHPLNEAEIEALWALTAIRLCTSVCLSAHRRSAEPDNAYLRVSEAPAWKTLEAMREIHPRLAHYTLRAACGLPACPRTPAIEAWLAAHPEEIGPVVAADLAPAPVLDLSVGSPLFETPAQATDVAVMTPRIFRTIHGAGAAAGIGRYDEARLLYASDAFAGAGGEHPERRTVHIAVDLFAEPGAPVLAPLAGTVHAIRDNAARLDYGPTVILAHRPDGAPPFYTLFGHLSAESLRRLTVGDRVARSQRIGAIGEPPGNGDWPPHVHFQIVTDLLDRDGEFPGVARASQRAVWKSLSPDPNLILRLEPERVAAPPASAEDLRAQRRRRLGPSLSLAYRSPLEIVRGAGQYLYDETGAAYLDLVNNVAHVGHGHPRVVRAGAEQMAVLNTNTRYLHPAIVELAGRLTATLPEPLSVCFFVCSGSEANELALRMARAHTRGLDVIAVRGGYHGNTQGLIDVSSYKFDGPGGSGPPPWVQIVPMPDDYRGAHRRDDPERGAKYAEHVREAAARIHDRRGSPAAFLCESVLSCGGQIELPPGYLAAAYRHARAAGAVCIADEVQVGFGRVGTHFWAFQTQGVVPDIVTMGKPIGNGHPLAAVVTTPAIAASFANGMEYFNTFGGNPVSCRIGLAVLDVMRDEGLQERALRVGGRLALGLARLSERHPIVGDVRGLGLFLGIELSQDRVTRAPAARQAAYVVERMKDHGILLSTDGPDHNVIKMKPPLCVTEADVDRVLAAYDRVLGEDFVRWR
ncbi:MAG TPA: aminotransferase class III-fold pyridoxal phosphate-dependent enzyme [Thermoanaerobaculia bacterium]